MSAARSAILSRVAAARRTMRLPPPPDVERIAIPSRSTAECLERFSQELAALGVDLHLETTAADVREQVRQLAEGKRLLSWDAERLPYEVGSVLAGAAFGSSPREEQARAEVGVTGCDAAIAETGSLVLLSGKGRSRAVSLLPPLHVAIVQPQQLCFSMAEFFVRERDRIEGEACCTFVTGPSRTADIELTLTLGVHGPGRVVVVVGP
jgi:L-lactate dehydrogenase complex protein LldG